MVRCEVTIHTVFCGDVDGWIRSRVCTRPLDLFSFALRLMLTVYLPDWVTGTERTCPLKKALVVFCMLISIACLTKYVIPLFVMCYEVT